MEKKRLDVYLTENNLAPTREKAQAIIMSGIVFVNNQKADKAGFFVKEGDNVEVRGKSLKYVSRGGLKLEKAIEKFAIELEGSTCMDIGASTGGFTDCMLQNGAVKVYCVDVGYGQLDYRLRTDERIVNMERTNIRYIEADKIDNLDFISIDVSFISLKLVLPVAYNLLKESGELVCLVKPQFEAGREKVGKKGIVREKSTHIEVLESTIDFAQSLNFSVKGIDFSPITGADGNIEFLLHLTKSGDNIEIDIKKEVEDAHSQLNR